jgi:hypothetical protein
LFIAGLAIVRVHNRWTNGWPVLVTILGWLFVLGLGAFLSFKAHIDVIDHALRSPVYLASSMSLTAVCRVVLRTPLGPPYVCDTTAPAHCPSKLVEIETVDEHVDRLHWSVNVTVPRSPVPRSVLFFEKPSSPVDEQRIINSYRAAR